MHLAVVRFPVLHAKAVLRAAALVLLLGVVPPSIARANLLANGGFEAGVTPTLPDGARCCYSILPVGSTDITSWAVTRNSINYTDGFFQCSNGVRCVDLNHTAGGGVSQSIPTQPGKRYVVSFDLAGNPIAGSSPALKRVRVEAAGQFIEFTFDVTGHTPENMGWTVVSWDFIAAGTTTSLELFSLTTGGEGPVIDNVVVDFPVPVDESTWGRIKALFR